jgi:hypothetical protein
MVCKEGGKDSGLCRIRDKHLHRRERKLTLARLSQEFESFQFRTPEIAIVRSFPRLLAFR